MCRWQNVFWVSFFGSLVGILPTTCTATANNGMNPVAASFTAPFKGESTATAQADRRPRTGLMRREDQPRVQEGSKDMLEGSEAASLVNTIEDSEQSVASLLAHPEVASILDRMAMSKQAAAALLGRDDRLKELVRRVVAQKGSSPQRSGAVESLLERALADHVSADQVATADDSLNSALLGKKRDDKTPTPTQPPPRDATPAPTEEVTTSSPPTAADAAPNSTITLNVLQWNVHWLNHHVSDVAAELVRNVPDIIGLNECNLDTDALVAAMKTLTPGATYLNQPYATPLQAYGTRIIYDSNKWSALEGGMSELIGIGTKGGNRAANWAVLQHKASGRKIITGGVHLSYCSNTCDQIHVNELTPMYERFEEMRSAHGNPATVWMGDLNGDSTKHVIQDLFAGKVGSKTVFQVEDLAQPSRTHTSGRILDFILGEKSKFTRIAGGAQLDVAATSTPGGNSDHFPVWAQLAMAGQ